MENYVEIEPNVWKPQNKGDEFEGILIAVKEGTYGKVYCFEWEKKQFIVFGTAVLDDRMNYVNVGERVKVVFKGTVRNKKGQDTKIFSVYRHEPKESVFGKL